MSKDLLSSPFVHNSNSVWRVMFKVLLALSLPMLFWLLSFGWLGFLQILLAVVVGLVCEGFALSWRKVPVIPFMQDGSVLVAMLLLAFCIPPLAPWWVISVAAMVAILLAKHCYGGLGQNLFNPAMVGYAVVLVSFPEELAVWPKADLSWLGLAANPLLDLWSAVQTIFIVDVAALADGYTGATILAYLRMQPTLAVEWLNQTWLWFNVVCLIAGLLLVWWKVISWHIPVSFLTSVIVVSLVFSSLGWLPSQGVAYQLGLGSTMMAAFFILTDPVSAATSPTGKLIYAAFAGLVLVIIRTWGNYPDAIVFAVLLANLVVPILDNYCLPRVKNRL